MKKIVVLGGGISGYGSAVLAKKMGHKVFLSDAGRVAERYATILNEWGVEWEQGGHTMERILAADLVVKSPGIPEKAEVVKALRAQGTPIISEMEFAAKYMGKARTICITGSNGKTTIKEWIAQCAPSNVKIFRSPRSYNSQLGVALSLLMLDNTYDVAIIEAGISQKGEMERLYKMIEPDMVIFTSIGDAHAQGFASLEEKISEKLILAQTAPEIIYHSAYSELAKAISTTYHDRNLVDAACAKILHSVDCGVCVATNVLVWSKLSPFCRKKHSFLPYSKNL